MRLRIVLTAFAPDESPADSLSHQIGAAAHTELRVDVLGVCVGGIERDTQRRRDLLRLHSRRQQFEYLVFARRQRRLSGTLLHRRENLWRKHAAAAMDAA